jgi:hypothetical protein
MKKLLFITALVAAAVGAQAQGTVNFNNHNTGAGIDQPVYDIGNTTKISDPNIVAALFLNDVQQGDAAPFRTGAAAGYWSISPDSTRTITGAAAGASVTLTVKAWDSTKGSTYAAAVTAGGKYGSSDPFTVQLGGQGPSGPPAVPADMIGFKSFSLVPEPSTIALGALGAAALLLRRRK